MTPPTQTRKGDVFVTCAYCGKENNETWCESEGFSIVRCACGVAYPNPRSTTHELVSAYNDQEISGLQDYLEVEEDNKKDFTKRLALIERVMRRKGKLLDVGCNIGSMVAVARDRGWDCFGIDINKQAVGLAVGQGLPCATSDFFGLQETFDLIVLNDVIEHLEDPIAALKKAHSLLNEGGYLYVSTPKGDSIMSQYTKGRWLHRKPREHLYIFTNDTMRAMLEENGFDISHTGTVGRTRSVGVILRKLGAYSQSLNAFLVHVVPKWIKDLSLYINPFDEMYFLAKKKIS